jgi:hypothetical protein
MKIKKINIFLFIIKNLMVTYMMIIIIGKMNII